MRRISKYIAGAMAVCMIATNLTTPVVYAMEQTVDITSSTVTESDEVADISSGQKELDVPINSEAENSNSTEESVNSAVSVPEDTKSRIGTVPKQKNGTAQLCNNLYCPVFDDNLSRIAG